MGNNVCAIVGFGPGLGVAYAEVFQADGYDLALLSRTGAEYKSAKGNNTSIKSYACDAGNPESLTCAANVRKEPKSRRIEIAPFALAAN